MGTFEGELKDLRDKNNELVQKVQYWKVLAAQRENEKLDLMKEINELRLKLSRLRSNGNVQAKNFDAALQSASEKALAHLVRASSEIASTMELAKVYMRDRQELDAISPRWSSIGNTSSSDKKDKIHRVPPLMMGGQSIQPVVSLSRTMLDFNSIRAATRSTNESMNVTERVPVPMRMLQDAYIPLTRIDASDLQTSLTVDSDTEPSSVDNSGVDLALDESEERVIDESERMSEDEDYNVSRILDAVTEDVEPEDEELTPPRNRIDNPLEGPSWLLDSTADNQAGTSKLGSNLEPDSTTELDEGVVNTRLSTSNTRVPESGGLTAGGQFTPTVRRRKRSPSPSPARTPHFSPRPLANRRISNSGRVLKVLVAKMSLEGAVGAGAGAGEGAGEGEAVSPPKRRTLSPQLDAPSPNGATVAGVIVSEAHDSTDELASGEPSPHARRPSQLDHHGRDHDHHDRSVHEPRYERSRRDRRSGAGRNLDTRNVTVRTDSRARSVNRDERRSVSRQGSNSSHESDSSSGDVGEGRTRRTRKVVTYKEKPLNRKMRR